MRQLFPSYHKILKLPLLYLYLLLHSNLVLIV
nr:MAG TPA: hypothetical protein [Caudoviricetes sp.]